MKKVVCLLMGLMMLGGIALAQAPVSTPNRLQQRVLNRIPARFKYLNSVQLEGGGSGGAYSLNYERVLLNGIRYKTSLRVGAAFYPPRSGLVSVVLPVLLNEMVSFGRHHLEAGVGIVGLRNDLAKRDPNSFPGPWGMFLAGRLGYRYQKPDGHLILKAAFTPLIEMNLWNLPRLGLQQPRLLPFFGGTVGYAF